MPGSDKITSPSRMRDFIFRKLQATRPGHPFTRVSSGLLDYYESVLRAIIIADIADTPLMGKTFCDSMHREKHHSA